MITKTEKLTGSYVPFENPGNLAEGSIVDGLNVRRADFFSGWKPRPGYTLINTTSIGSELKALFRYTNPRWQDYHLITQVGNSLRDNTISTEELLTQGGETLLTQSLELLLAISSGSPLAQTANMGASIFDGVSATPGFACVVSEDWIFADGSGKPVIYGGKTPTCNGFLVDDGSSNISDYTKLVRNTDTSTYAILPSDASMVYYVCSKEIANAIHLGFGSSVNTNSVTATVSAWRSGSWTSVSASDGTSGTVTHDTDGSFEWTAGADEVRVLGGIMGYWYRVSVSGAMTITHVVTCRISRPAVRMTNKWNGVYNYPTGVLFYDASDTSYVDVLGLVTNTSESQYLDLSSATTSDYLYVKAPEGIVGIGVVMVQGSENGNAATIDGSEYWNGSAWTSLSRTDDTTNDGGTVSFAQSGTVWLDLTSQTSVRRQVGSDAVAGHWIRLSWSAALSADVKIATIVYVGLPDEFPTVNGCVEYNGRALYWGPFEYQNRLLISPYQKPDQLDDLDGRYSPPFGGDDIIIGCIVLEDVVLVAKEKGLFFMIENSDGTFSVNRLTSQVGLSSPKSLVTAEVGESNLRNEEIIPIVLFEDLDGWYKISRQGNIVKISDVIRNYFDPNASEYIGAANVGNTQGYFSPLDGTLRAIYSDRELVYNIKRAEWYPSWQRELTLTTATAVKGTNNQYTLIGGTSEGFLINLEDGTSDRDSSNSETTINHKIKTRVIYALDNNSNQIKGTFRYLWAEFKTDTGTITSKIFLNRVTSGTSITSPSAMSLVDSGKDYTLVRQELSESNTYCFAFEFESDTLNQTMEILGFTHAIAPVGSVGL